MLLKSCMLQKQSTLFGKYIWVFRESKSLYSLLHVQNVKYGIHIISDKTVQFIHNKVRFLEINSETPDSENVLGVSSGMSCTWMEERNRQFNNYIYNYMIIVQTYIYVYLQPTICINKYICMYGDITKYMESPFLESNSHSNSEASPPTSSHHISISSTSICTSSCST